MDSKLLWRSAKRRLQEAERNLLQGTSHEASWNAYGAVKDGLTALVSDQSWSLSALASLLPSPFPTPLLENLEDLSALEDLPSHTADAGIYYQEDPMFAVRNVESARRLMKWIEQELERKLTSENHDSLSDCSPPCESASLATITIPSAAVQKNAARKESGMNELCPIWPARVKEWMGAKKVSACRHLFRSATPLSPAY